MYQKMLLLSMLLGCPVWSGLVPLANAVDYQTQIKPLLAEKCYSCHGALEQESSLRLETRELMMQGGDSGAAIVPGDADRSLIIERMTTDGFDRMPPAEQGAAMTADQIDLIRQWIESGAEAPHEAIPPAPSEHWAFQPIQRPEISDSSGNVHPLDALLEVKRRDQGVQVQSAADRTLQVRRLYLDLVGLPPTIEQLEDDRPWNVLVDDLLHRPEHGERWARHWMDIWRYCDWYGLGNQLRNSQKHLWHWRDWIVDSLNEDKGYDRMVLEMLAGDELDPTNPDVVVATGYLARNYYLFNRTTWLDNTIEHASKAFLGLTMNCAKCHDHKYDPISQDDYYRMRAIFEPHQVRLDPVPGVTNFETDGLPRVFDDHIDLATYLHVRGDPTNPDTENPIDPGVPQILSRFSSPIQPIDLPSDAYAPGTRGHVRTDRLVGLDAEVARAEKILAEARKRSQQQRARLANEPNKSESQPESQPESLAQQADEFVDEFETLDPDVWSIIGDGWQLQEGRVHQTVATREKQLLRLKQELPRDFDLTCQYTTTGGSTYKSVTFRFDESEDAKHANFVYTSAHAPGPKVQAAYTRDGQNAYPPAGRRAVAIEIGRSYRLRFAIRGTLVNVWLDDEFMLAYQFPDRQPGALSLSGFDATVAFDSIRIAALDPEVALQPASGSTPAKSEVTVPLAEAGWKLAKARRASFVASWNADRARWGGSSADSEIATLSRAAAGRQVDMEIAAAEYEAIEKAGDEKAVAAVRKRIDSANLRRTKLETEVPSYKSIRASRKALETPAHKEPDYAASYSPRSTGRRLALAKWIVHPENPLTARVAVNHVWLRHFGQPLVESVFDFGLRAKQPVQSDVLDFLAYEFITSGWSFRHLHRLIVTSDAYRLASTTLGADEATLLKDPDNQLYWRMNTTRMESQVVRDAILSLAGKLDLAVGGPSIDPAKESFRRSLYFQHSRDQQDKFLEMFDDADELQCYRRSESIVPQQALALSNSKLAIEMSAQMARRFSNSVDRASRNDFIQTTFRSLLGRIASDAEIAECREYFNRLAELTVVEPSEIRMRERFVHAILNHNDFVTIR
ncbi:MAG: DUF1553 domain-containing protein [Rubripirellula sp.]|nr:DUF1553 domain-containing protein [Rubripirellula sp.]